MKIFISYRRTDSADVTGRIYDRIKDKFGGNVVFKDVDSIPFGVDFRTYIDEAVQGSDVMLVVIGDKWLYIQDENVRRRLDDPNDFVRLEIEAALRRNIPVIPLFVQNVTGINEHELPESLQSLAYRNGTRIRHDPDFHNDMDRLLRGLGGPLASYAVQKPVEKSATSLPPTVAPPANRPPRPMIHKEKVKYMLADLEKRGAKGDSLYYASPYYRVMWFLGSDLVPPYFQGILTLFVSNSIFGFMFYFLFFLISGILSGDLEFISSEFMLFVGLCIMGAFGGIIMTYETRKRAKKLNLPPWKDYPNA